MLRTKFPASESQLVIAPGKLRMDESDKAQDYLNSVQRQYVIHQIVLPHTFKKHKNNERLAQPSVIEAKSHIDWPSRGLSRGTPDLSKQACTGK